MDRLGKMFASCCPGNFYTATRADLILTHQTLGISQSSRASSSARETQALRSRAAELPARGACCLNRPLSAFQTLFYYRLTGLSRTVLILKYILENKRKVWGEGFTNNLCYHLLNNSQITKILSCVLFDLSENNGMETRLL